MKEVDKMRLLILIISVSFIFTCYSEDTSKAELKKANEQLSATLILNLKGLGAEKYINRKQAIDNLINKSLAIDKMQGGTEKLKFVRSFYVDSYNSTDDVEVKFNLLILLKQVYTLIENNVMDYGTCGDTPSKQTLERKFIKFQKENLKVKIVHPSKNEFREYETEDEYYYDDEY